MRSQDSNASWERKLCRPLNLEEAQKLVSNSEQYASLPVNLRTAETNHVLCLNDPSSVATILHYNLI